VVAVLAILLWFVLYTFLFSTDLSDFGLSANHSNGASAEYQPSNPKSNTAAGFAAFEKQKAADEAHKAFIEKRDKAAQEAAQEAARNAPAADPEGAAQQQGQANVNPTKTSNSNATVTTARTTNRTNAFRPLPAGSAITRTNALGSSPSMSSSLPKTTSIGSSTRLSSQTSLTAPNSGKLNTGHLTTTQQVNQRTSAPVTAVLDQLLPTQQNATVVAINQRSANQGLPFDSSRNTSSTGSTTNTVAAISTTATAAASASTPKPNRANSIAVQAVLSVDKSINCTEDYTADLIFSKNSTAMRGSSLRALDSLIEQHKKCFNSVFMVRANRTDETAIMLDQRRQDEVKYYLLQRSVEKANIKLGR